MLNLIVLLVVGTFLLNGGEAAVTWSNPSGGSGVCGTIAETSSAGALSLTLTAASDGTQTGGSGATIAAYTVLALDMPHHQASLSIGGTSGIVSLASGDLFHETGTTMVFKATATDNAATPASSTATCTVSITDANAMPAFAAGVAVYATVSTTVAAQATLTTYTATDSDSGQTLTYAIASGNTNSDLAVASGTGEITVAVGQTLDKATTATYTLLITATDNGSPAHSATGTLSICVGPCSNGVSLTIGLLTLFLALMVSFN